ncbi:hypothetical protein C2G38_2035213 [Gigaspora rosea]|uniref:Uncharacterized protein n=1 Tax=Gigaspora rosea TaxID=44941 RepID=A0A397VFB0_9GLOM|nr:hypothetical protein C2G38_2035213 [Gigaspora rosea]
MRNQKLVLMLDQFWVSSKPKTFFPASFHVPQRKLKEKMVLSMKQEKQKTNTYYREIPSSFQTQNAIPGFNLRFLANLKRELVKRKAKKHKEKQPKMKNQKLVLMLDQPWVSSKFKSFFLASIHVSQCQSIFSGES